MTEIKGNDVNAKCGNSHKERGEESRINETVFIASRRSCKAPVPLDVLVHHDWHQDRIQRRYILREIEHVTLTCTEKLAESKISSFSETRAKNIVRVHRFNYKNFAGGCFLDEDNGIHHDYQSIIADETKEEKGDAISFTEHPLTFTSLDCNILYPQSSRDMQTDREEQLLIAEKNKQELTKVIDQALKISCSTSEKNESVQLLSTVTAKQTNHSAGADGVHRHRKTRNLLREIEEEQLKLLKVQEQQKKVQLRNNPVEIPTDIVVPIPHLISNLNEGPRHRQWDSCMSDISLASVYSIPYLESNSLLGPVRNDTDIS